MKQTMDLFILGAGASQPFGFPVGVELKNQAIEELASGRRVREIVDQIGENTDFKSDDVTSFVNALRSATRELSIDTFIESRRGQAYLPIFSKIAKAVTAILIMQHEEDAALAASDWYGKLLDRMYRGNNNPQTFFENRVAFVTFNYDRSLERYLALEVSNVLGLSLEETSERLSEAFLVVHPHGSLGELWPASAEAKAYAPDWEILPAVIKASQAIRLITDEIDPAADPRFQGARQLIQQAARVHFIGFGYHPNNMQRLGFGDPDAALGNLTSKYFGTERGLSRQEVFQIRRQYQINNTAGVPTVTSLTQEPGQADAAEYMDIAPFD